jgi:outer membrane protein assembly factor BamB
MPCPDSLPELSCAKARVQFLLAGLVLILAGPPGLTAADQPQWGEAWSRNMVSSERGLVQEFEPKSGRNIRWRVPLGTETHSTPIVAKGRVYIGTNNDQPREPRHQGDRGILMCLSETDGKLLWQLVVPKREEDPFHDWPKTGISSAVTVEDERVYLVNNRGEVMCLDAQGWPTGMTARSARKEPTSRPAAPMRPLSRSRPALSMPISSGCST